MKKERIDKAGGGLPLVIALLVMGVSGITAQIILLREILVSFLGNEFSIGVVLANWLLLEAVGAFLGGRAAERFGNRRAAFVLLTVLFALSFPPAAAASRLLRQLFSGAGEGAGIVTILYSSFLVLLPVSFLHGALFPFGCRLYSDTAVSRRGAAGIGRVYVLETLGTLTGGAVLTFLLLPRLDALSIAVWVAALNLAAAGVVLAFPRRGGSPFPAAVLLALALTAAWFPLSSRSASVNLSLASHRWPGQELLFYRDSIYGNVAVTSREGQYNFYSDGVPLVSTPVPDIAGVEEFAHFSLLAHPRPRRVLLLSGGAGGLAAEVLKHPLQRTDYVELDPLVLEAVARFPTPLTVSEMEDPRLRTVFADGRRFLAAGGEDYDAILVGISELSSLQANRFFTEEFFALAQSRLGEGGILAFRLPGSLTYLGKEMRDLNASILRSLDAVFPETAVIPGDGENLFLASPGPGPVEIRPEELARRMEEREIETRLLTPFHLDYRFDRRWRDWFESSLEGAAGRPNRDFRPSGVFFSLAYWSALFNPAVSGVFRFLQRLTLTGLGAAVLAAGGLYLLFLRLHPRPLKTAVPAAVAATGLTGMIVDLVLIFAFQVIYGYVFHWVGLLVTAFMTGVLAGGLAMTSRMERIRRPRLGLAALETSLILLCLLLAGLVALAARRPVPPGFLLPVQAVFLLLSFLSGGLVGAEFPLASRVQLLSGPRLGSTAGLLYASDLMGGWLGGIAGAVALLPVLGLDRTCLLLALVKLVSLSGLVVSGKNRAAAGGAGIR